MNATYIWIALPMVAALLMWLIRNDRWVAAIGSLLALGLAIAAAALPVDSAIGLGPIAFRIEPDIVILGRRLIIEQADQPLLVLIYGMVSFWLFGTLAVGGARRLVPMGLAITAMLVASLAVEPFLYAALIIEMAVLASIPLLASQERPASRGMLRFLVYQTLGMPFILLAGFLLSGVEASPADLALVVQSATLLGLGFAFLLAVFPFYSWIPMLAEEHKPYIVSFILVIFPSIIMLFGMGFLDRFSWLRESPRSSEVLQLAGVIMVVTGGIWSALQRHIGRILGYAFIGEIGVSLLAISLPNQQTGVEISFALLIPRIVALGTWAMAANVIQFHAPKLGFTDIQGALRAVPIASATLILSQFSLVGMPLLGSFPIRQSLWEQLSSVSLSTALWFGIGTFGFWIAAARTLAVMAIAPEGTEWESRETWIQRIMLSLGVLGLIILGIFPHWTQPFIANLPLVFDRLGR